VSPAIPFVVATGVGLAGTVIFALTVSEAQAG
jgi:hypothetical protein